MKTITKILATVFAFVLVITSAICISGCKDKNKTRYTRIGEVKYLDGSEEKTLKSFWIYGINSIKVSFTDNSGGILDAVKYSNLHVFCVSETPIQQNFHSNSVSGIPNGFLEALNSWGGYDLTSNGGLLYSPNYEKFCNIEVVLRVVKDACITINSEDNYSEISYYSPTVDFGWVNEEINDIYSQASLICQNNGIQISYTYRNATEAEMVDALWSSHI